MTPPPNTTGSLPRNTSFAGVANGAEAAPGVEHDHDVNGEPESHDHADDGTVSFAEAGPIEVPEPLPGTSASDYFNGDHDPDRGALEAEAHAIAHRRPDAIRNGQPRPVSVAGAPGSRLADVAARAANLTLEGYPAEIQDEVIWTEIASHTLTAMREEQARTRGPADPALVVAALDAVDHIARARGLVTPTGGGS